MNAQADLQGKSFEELLEMLEAAVNELDGDTLTLAQSVAAYERSVEISNACEKLLNEAELHIEQIDAKNSSALEEDISEDDVPF